MRHPRQVARTLGCTHVTQVRTLSLATDLKKSLNIGKITIRDELKVLQNTDYPQVGIPLTCKTHSPVPVLAGVFEGLSSPDITVWSPTSLESLSFLHFGVKEI